MESGGALGGFVVREESGEVTAHLDFTFWLARDAAALQYFYAYIPDRAGE